MIPCNGFEDEAGPLAQEGTFQSWHEWYLPSRPLGARHAKGLQMENPFLPWRVRHRFLGATPLWPSRSHRICSSLCLFQLELVQQCIHPHSPDWDVQHSSGHSPPDAQVVVTVLQAADPANDPDPCRAGARKAFSWNGWKFGPGRRQILRFFYGQPGWTGPLSGTLSHLVPIWGEHVGGQARWCRVHLHRAPNVSHYPVQKWLKLRCVEPTHAVVK